MKDVSEENQSLQIIIGEELTSVTFVCDYIVFAFDEIGITALNDCIVMSSNEVYSKEASKNNLNN